MPLFEADGVKIGIQICFDWAFQESWRLLALQGAQVIAHPSNLVMTYAQKAIPAYALINKIFIITANRIGREKDLGFIGHSIIANPEGNIITEAGNVYTETGQVNVDISKANNKQITLKNNIFADRRIDIYELKTKQ